MVLQDTHKVRVEDQQKVTERTAGGGTCIRAGGHWKVRPGKLHYEGRGADPLRGGGKAAAEAEDRVDPILLQ